MIHTARTTHGTPEQFLDALKNKINELSEGSDITTAIKTSDVENYRDTSQPDDTYRSRYLHDLIGEVEDELSDISNIVAADYNDKEFIVLLQVGGKNRKFKFAFNRLSFQFETIDMDVTYITDFVRDAVSGNIAEDDSHYEKDYVESLMLDVESNLYPYTDSINYQIHDKDVTIVVVSDKGIREYKVPFDDLTMDPEDHGPDVDYIVNFIDRDLNISGDNDYDGYTPEDWKPAIIKKLESEDVDVSTPEAEDYIDRAAEMIQNDDDHDVDYWWNEVMSNDDWRQEINDLPHLSV